MPRPIHARLKQRRFRNPAETAFVGLVLVGEHIATRLDEVCGRHGLTHGQYNVLRILRGAHPDGHPRFEIANRLMRRAPDVTRLLDRLERQGYITRTWRPDNRRQSIASITAAGLAVLDAIDPELDVLQRSTFRRFTAEQVRQLGFMLDRVLAE